MQFNQMNPPFNAYNYGPQIEINRHVIGEGNVTSQLYPDGSIQYFFMPTSQWCPPMYNTINSINPMWNANVAVWLVRSINNPLPQPEFCQMPPQKQSYNLDISDSDRTFKLKFHNDSWTSTTDLVYFYPSLRSSNWLTGTQYKGSAGVQVELPPWTVCHCDGFRKLCNCAQNEAKKHICDKQMEDEVVTSMSIDDMCSKCEKDEKKPSKHLKKSCFNGIKTRSNKNVSCQCDDLPKSKTKHKLVSTFADQASNCLDQSEQLTQTTKTTSSSTLKIGSKDNIQPKSWSPKSSFTKKARKSKSSETSLPLSSCTSECSCHDHD